MAILKCKMCGGNLELLDDSSVCECDHCGRKQTVPTPDDERKLALFDRANQLRATCDFEKAAGIYEAIVAEFPAEAEAYWGLVLCKYGIEYVDDPLSNSKIPTCHRSSFVSVLEDEDYKSTLKNASFLARQVYEAEAKQIEALRKGIIEVSEKEEPYDIFICFKEHNDLGDRTPDSVFAQEIYDALTEKGYRVFFSRITLEDKLGTEYEPYIFAALNSAKIMLAFGTSKEYYNSVWVKNEWSRFLQLIASGEKKTLIPCFADMDVADMPKGFSIRQAQNMAKLGWQQDLLRGVEKILPKKQERATAPAAVSQTANNPTVASLLKRVFIFLEDREFASADEYAEKVLDIDPENAEAYLGKLLAELRVTNRKYLVGQVKPFDTSVNYKKALRYADPALKEELTGCIDTINKRIKLTADKAAYSEATAAMQNAKTGSDWDAAAKKFAALGDFEDSTALAQQCRERSVLQSNLEIYNQASKKFNSIDPDEILRAKPLFEMISDFKDSAALASQCEEKAQRVRSQLIFDTAKQIYNTSSEPQMLTKAVLALMSLGDIPEAVELRNTILYKRDQIVEAQRLKEEKEQADRIAAEKAKKRKALLVLLGKILLVILALGAAAALIYGIYYGLWGEKQERYEAAVAQYEIAMAGSSAEEYEKAIALFAELHSYEDSKERCLALKYAYADYKLDNGDIDGAYALYCELAGYDTVNKKWIAAEAYMDSKTKRAEIVTANPRFAEVGDVIVFGSYEQDNNTDNGQEPISWYVMEKKDGRFYLMSQDALDYMPWREDSSGYHYDWADSTVRTWLGTTFYDTAFTPEEKEQIYTHTFNEDDRETEDPVFLVGASEISKKTHEYLFSDYEISPYATAKCDKGNILNEKLFWCRTSGAGGGAYHWDIYGKGEMWSYQSGLVRPCIYLNIEE
ncbi:MAG: toll/interleukin-1 receptor domain-containing protein [Ruminococcaceae bacterium]|nr:toll/interleukin-1 receptor domain-containing protein [Oscillospiraceae bacterium]